MITIPRKPQITRTINVTVATAMCVNAEAQHFYKREFVTIARWKTRQELLAILRRAYETENQTILAVVDTRRETQLRTMPISEFLEKSTLIEKR